MKRFEVTYISENGKEDKIICRGKSPQELLNFMHEYTRKSVLRIRKVEDTREYSIDLSVSGIIKKSRKAVLETTKVNYKPFRYV